jgi:hypothetical protein
MGRVPLMALERLGVLPRGAAGTTCWHAPRAHARYSAVFYRDILFVYRSGRPDNPVVSAKGRPRTGDGERRLVQRAGMSPEQEGSASPRSCR